MNPSTLVVVHCYAGDQQRVEDFLPQFLHHECPVLILSPNDAPVDIRHPGVTCRSAGMKGWKGPDTIYRQIAHWEIAAEYEADHYLMHDADSICLTPELPRYLYEEDPEIFWCNVIGTYYYNYEPPYFFSRNNLLRMIDVAHNPGEEMQQAIGTVIRNDRGTLKGLLKAVEELEAMSDEEMEALIRDEREDVWSDARQHISDQGFHVGELLAILANPHTLKRELKENIAAGKSTFPDWGACNAIDGFYVAITTYLGLEYKSYPDGSHGGDMKEMARAHRFRMFHPVKTKEEVQVLLLLEKFQGANVVFEPPPAEVIAREMQGQLDESVRT